MVLGSDLRRGHTTTGRGPRAAGRGTALATGRGTALAAALVLVLAPALVACSDESGGSQSAPPTPSVERTSSAPATAPADPAAAEKEIRQNWKKFFDPATATKDKQGVLENGDKMSAVLKSFNGDKRGGQVAAEVTKVEFTGPAEATVTYTLTLNGATALPDASGTAVLEDGTWKVSDNTLCALVQLSGDASQSAHPGC